VPSGEEGAWVEDVMCTLRHLQAYTCEGFPVGVLAGLPLAIQDLQGRSCGTGGLVCNASCNVSASVSSKKIIK
jgi:hypothetical protein